MKKIAIATLAMITLFAFSTAGNAQPIAQYDHTTGSISFSWVENVLVFRLDSPNNLLRSGEITNLDGLAVPPFGAAADTAPSFLEWGLITGFNFEDPISGGNVIPIGLTNEELNTEFEFNYFLASDPATPVRGVILGVTCDCLFPEPTTMVMAGLGLLMITGTRRGVC